MKILLDAKEITKISHLDPCQHMKGLFCLIQVLVFVILNKFLNCSRKCLLWFVLFSSKVMFTFYAEVAFNIVGHSSPSLLGNLSLLPEDFNLKSSSNLQTGPTSSPEQGPPFF